MNWKNIFCVCLFLTPLCVAETIHVNWDGSGDYTTIQAGINAAVNGDTVIIADGTYTGDGNRDIDFGNGLAEGQTRAITVRSESGPETCIIDCQGSYSDLHRGFYFHNGADANSVIDGFTITNGYDYGGGGISCHLADPTITNCIITDNYANPYYYSSGPFGGGLYCWHSNPIIKNCVITENFAIMGAGIYNYYSSPTITNCTFSQNFAGYGAGMYNSNSSPIVTNCIFWETNSISGSEANTTLTYCNVKGGYLGLGNIDVDPLFVDPANGDYHLKSQAGSWDPISQSWMIDDVTSPCIDAGDPGSPIYPIEPSPNGGRINMGVYGGTVEASMTPDCMMLGSLYPGDPLYDEWDSVGSPECWCYPRQCHGDTDNVENTAGYYGFPPAHWVGTPDLGVLAFGYQKPNDDSEFGTFICADFDRTEHPAGYYGFPPVHRVGSPDLGILAFYYQKGDTDPEAPPADCLPGTL